MKKSIIISALILPGIFLVFSSNSNGPGTAGNGIRNGGPSSTGTCGSCHSGGSGTTTINISLAEKASGNPAGGVYKPGVVYTVILSGTNPNLAFFGFQFSAATATHQQAGTFSNVGADKHISNISNLQIVEHSTVLNKVGGNYVASFDWTAPAAGKGTVTLYGMINAVNDDDGILGDKPSAPANLSLMEQASTSINNPELTAAIKVYPNPATDILQVESGIAMQGKYKVSILDVNGRTVLSSMEYISAAANLNVSLKNINRGLYFLRIEGNNQKVSKTFVKK